MRRTHWLWTAATALLAATAFYIGHETNGFNGYRQTAPGADADTTIICAVGGSHCIGLGADSVCARVR